MPDGELPRSGTKTRDVLEAFDVRETLTSAEVANRVEWVAVDNDAGAVTSQLRNLTDRGFLEREPGEPYSEYTRIGGNDDAQ